MSTKGPSLRKLAGQTIIYGVSSVLGRAISFVLLPLYTAVFSTAEYGVQSLVYVYAPILFVFYVLRFDTAYFRFASDEKWKSNCFDSTFTTIGVVSLMLSLVLIMSAPWLTASVFNISSEYTYIIRIMGVILFFDALSEIPYAKLRLENKAIRFATIRMVNIFVNVGLNCFFLLFIPWYLGVYPDSNWFNWYNPELGIGFIFISNVVASIVVFLLLTPQLRHVRLKVDGQLLNQMWSYAYPLVIVAIAGIVNELIDRVMLDRLLPYDDETNKAQVGIYSAAYKFSIIISLFTQAYRYAAEPFFFSHARDKRSPEIYARAAEYFVIAACIGFLCIMFFLPQLKYLMRQADYHEGLVVVPILIMANIFLGIYYNLSVWYKLTDKTRFAMYIALAGACTTILLNYFLIPVWGYLGSAWATCCCYGLMTFLSFYIGRKHYELKHNLNRLCLYMLSSVFIYYLIEGLVSNFVLIPALKYIIYILVLVAIGWWTFVKLRSEQQKI